jgi:biopolymer transport protein TolR
MDLGGARGGMKADINVTPLVDVMLVLLIIVMLIAPMLQKGVDVKLPEAANTTDKPETQEQTVVAIDASRQLWLNGIRIREDDLRPQIETLMESRTEKIVLIKADVDAPYSSIMATMDRLREARIENIGLVTEKKTGSSSGGQ